LLDGPPPTPPLPALALPLSFFCLPSGAPHAPSTSCGERGGAHSCNRNAAPLITQLYAVEPNVGQGWSVPHLRLSGLLLIRKDLCRHAVRRLPLLRDVLPSLLCTLPGRRLLCACGALELSFELSEHLRHLMVTYPDAWRDASPPSILAAMSAPNCANTVTASAYPTCRCVYTLHAGAAPH
jgi:hypothetical protein